MNISTVLMYQGFPMLSVRIFWCWRWMAWYCNVAVWKEIYKYIRYWTFGKFYQNHFLASFINNIFQEIRCLNNRNIRKYLSVSRESWSWWESRIWSVNQTCFYPQVNLVWFLVVSNISFPSTLNSIKWWNNASEGERGLDPKNFIKWQ